MKIVKTIKLKIVMFFSREKSLYIVLACFRNERYILDLQEKTEITDLEVRQSNAKAHNNCYLLPHLSRGLTS